MTVLLNIQDLQVSYGDIDILQKFSICVKPAEILGIVGESGCGKSTLKWGSMMNQGRSMLQHAPWLTLFPGGAILITVMIFNLLGDSVRDMLDPKQRKIIFAKKNKNIGIKGEIGNV